MKPHNVVFFFGIGKGKVYRPGIGLGGMFGETDATRTY